MEDVDFVGLGVEEDHELTMANFHLEHGFIHIHRLHGIAFRLDDLRLGIFPFLKVFRELEDVILDVVDFTALSMAEYMSAVSSAASMVI
jgi:hypothetical protein